MASSIAAPRGNAPAVYILEPGRVRSIRMPFWKRSFDVLAAGTALTLLSPFLIAALVVIASDSRGGPIFRQTRVGRGGRCFTCWKFRTMHRGADQMLDGLLAQNEENDFIFKMRADPRRTRVGKFFRKTSLDEVPQLFNVLRGDMSIVGPRPPTVPEVLRYDERHIDRLMATPGITGLWQVTLRGRKHEFADMVELDVRYAEELSPALDLRIILETVPTVLFGRGSY